MASRRKRSLHFNLKEGENVIFHRDHRSKKGRNRMNMDKTELSFRYKKKKEELKYGVDKNSLRYLKNRYKI
jgi:hypothetical protein